MTAAHSPEHDLRRCPACNSTDYHRTKRTAKERMMRHPPMARCGSCGMRFPYPGRHQEYIEPFKVVGVSATGPRSAEEEKAPKMAKEDTRPEDPKQVAPPGHSGSDLRRCPGCGSTKSHRTKRTTLERMFRRPPMARCENCGMRFPYHGHHHESPDSVKAGEAVARESSLGEEGRGSRTAEESALPNNGKQGTAADSSNRQLGCCPYCGSATYRRSRRTALEHFLLRPKMARCRHCRRRFPYPEI